MACARPSWPLKIKSTVSRLEVHCVYCTVWQWTSKEVTGIARHRRTLAGPTRGHCKTWLPIFNSSRLHITVILTALCVYQLLGQIDMDFVHIIYLLGSNLKFNFIIIYFGCGGSWGVGAHFINWEMNFLGQCFSPSFPGFNQVKWKTSKKRALSKICKGWGKEGRGSVEAGLPNSWQYPQYQLPDRIKFPGGSHSDRSSPLCPLFTPNTC